MYEHMYEMKKNIFDHILYEFEMYLYTYKELQNDIEQDKRNVLLESHAIHLRNLIEFFNRERDCITTKTIFSDDVDLSFHFSENDKKPINKAIEHLTMERVTKWNTEEDLTIQLSTLINTMYASYIPNRISKCIARLKDWGVVNKYLHDLEHPFIQQRLRQLETDCKRIKKNK